jgi:hypothetical protein
LLRTNHGYLLYYFIIYFSRKLVKKWYKHAGKFQVIVELLNVVIDTFLGGI